MLRRVGTYFQVPTSFAYTPTLIYAISTSQSAIACSCTATRPTTVYLTVKTN